MILDTQSVIQLIILLVLIFLSGFFSSAETALTTVNRVRIRSLTEAGDQRALTLQKVLDRHSKMLSTILIGNNIVNISASSLVTTLTIRVWGNFAVGIATGLLTIIILIFGEIVPKNWATLNAEGLSLAYARIILTLIRLLTPVIFVVDRLSRAVFRLFHIDPDSIDNSITESELRTIVDVSHEGGVIESEEKEMIYNVFDFGDSYAKDIMIPRIDMTTVNVNASFDELMEIFRDSMYTRIPVYENDSSNIIGLINMKDLLLVPDKESFRIRDILREAYYTYEYKKTADLLMEMRESNFGVTFVLNEYGATVGLITMEDLLEEIVGEIRDEYDQDEEELIRKTGDREYLIAGSMKLDDINDALDTAFTSEDYDSIGGLMIDLLDRLPEQGEKVFTDDDIELIAQEVSNNRIELVHVTLPEPESDMDDRDSSEDSAQSSELR